jgi:hypothetical protein
MPRQEYKKWDKHKDKLKDDLEDVCLEAGEGEWVAVIVKVDPKHNPISGYWIVKPPVPVPPGT